MTTRLFRLVPALALTGAIAGCAADGTLNTGSIDPAAQAKADPVCAQLFAHIDTLRKEGIADKVEKAANKKYKMTPADLVKADQLNKANADFQGKCTPQPVQASAQPAAPVASAPAAQ